jgi:hypothetical protein
MKTVFKISLLFGAYFAFATLAPMMIASAQFPSTAPLTVTGTPDPEPSVGGPVAVGQQMLQCDNAHPCSGPGVALIQAPPVVQPTGGVIQLSAFGWMEPYIDSAVQGLILAGLGWLMKSKYTSWMDQSARDAFGVFLQNTASSLIADGFVHMQDKTVQVSDAALAREANTAADRIPGALKRFGITPAVIQQRIIDAIPQTPAGAQMVAAAHAAEPAASQKASS